MRARGRVGILRGRRCHLLLLAMLLLLAFPQFGHVSLALGRRLYFFRHISRPVRMPTTRIIRTINSESLCRFYERRTITIYCSLILYAMLWRSCLPSSPHTLAPERGGQTGHEPWTRRKGQRKRMPLIPACQSNIHLQNIIL